MKEKELDIVITVNSPGEVATWLVPAIKALRRRLPNSEFTIFIPPCPFASGREAAIVAAVPGVERIFDGRQLLAYILAGRRPTGFTPRSRGAVLFLGGDLIYAALLARRLRYPAFAYTEGRVRWLGSFEGFFLPHEQAKAGAMKTGAPQDKLHVVGDLMLDAVARKRPEADVYQALRLDEHQPVIALFPGSRRPELALVLPLLLRSAEIITLDLRTVQFVVALSPFVAGDLLREALAGPPPPFAGTGGELIDEVANDGSPFSPRWRLKTRGGLELSVVQGWQYDLMAMAKLAITLPGSNTAEMAASGLPMLVITPLNKPEAIPLEGIPGLIDHLPLIGKPLKRRAVLAATKRVQYTSLPNRRAQAEIVPELMGVLHPEDIAIAVGNLMRNPEKLAIMSSRLQGIMGGFGASRRMAEIIAQALDEQRP